MSTRTLRFRPFGGRLSLILLFAAANSAIALQASQVEALRPLRTRVSEPDHQYPLDLLPIKEGHTE